MLEELSGYFALLAEPTRLRLLHLLCRGECSVSNAAIEMQSTHSNVSRQLGLLCEAKLIARRKTGAQVFYRIEDWQTIEICRAVCRHISKRMENRRQASETAGLFDYQGEKFQQLIRSKTSRKK